jgi:lysozyme family protein
MKGITLNVYREWKRNPHISKDELRVIPDEEVYNLYKELYWNKVQGDNLPAGVDYAVFDAAVNMGVGRAAKLIQEAVGVTADGMLGPASISAIQKTNPKELIEKFSQLKENFYRSLKTFNTFGVGWLRRVAEVKTFSESMLG